MAGFTPGQARDADALTRLRQENAQLGHDLDDAMAAVRAAEIRVKALEAALDAHRQIIHFLSCDDKHCDICHPVK